MTSVELTEATDLAECEAVIERGLGTFMEVGQALARIRDARLYLASHVTFEAYCDQRWGLARRTAYQMIDASGMVCAIAHTAPGAPLPGNEAQARALAPLRDDPEQMAEAMTEAHEATGGKPTARAIEEAVARRTEPAHVPEPEPEPDEDDGWWDEFLDDEPEAEPDPAPPAPAPEAPVATRDDMELARSLVDPALKLRANASKILVRIGGAELIFLRDNADRVAAVVPVEDRPSWLDFASRLRRTADVLDAAFSATTLRRVK